LISFSDGLFFSLTIFLSVEEVFVFHRYKGNKKGINQPPRPGNESCKIQIINRPGHPSFKRRGDFCYFGLLSYLIISLLFYLYNKEFIL